MNRQNRRRSILYGGASVFLFVLLFLATYRGRSEGIARLEAQIVTFGDSVFGETRDETAVPARLQELLGKSVYNAAMGGTCMGRTGDDRRMDYAKGSLSMAGLAKAVLAQDFAVQQSLRIRENKTEYFREVLNSLEMMDFSQVEMVLIQHGINDYHAAIPIENPEDLYDEYTYLGALRSAVRDLRRVNPDIRIVLVTPTYTWYIYTGLTCEEADQGSGVLEDYVDAQFRAGEELGLEVIDVYHDFYPHEKWEDKDLYTRDGLHPNEAGREKLARRIAQALSKGETVQ